MWHIYQAEGAMKMKSIESAKTETEKLVSGSELEKEQAEGRALLELMRLAEQDIAEGKTFTCEAVLEMLDTDFRKP